MNLKLKKMWEEIDFNTLSYHCSVCQYNLRQTTKNINRNNWFPSFRIEQHRTSESETDVV